MTRPRSCVYGEKAWAGKVFRPANGTEGYEFEAAFCERCDHYRPMVDDPDILDCTKGILMAAHAYDTDEIGYPRRDWVYDEEGYPTCVSWKLRTLSADKVPPRLCGGARTPEQERAAYEKAMQAR